MRSSHTPTSTSVDRSGTLWSNARLALAATSGSAARGALPMIVLAFVLSGMLVGADGVRAETLRARVIDAATKRPLEARVYLVDDAGQPYWVNSAAAEGRAIRYDKTNWINARSQEKHTSVSAHPFQAEVPAGRYRLTVERGQEYFPETVEVDVRAGAPAVQISLRRWSDIAAQGWYSGETHLHRSLDELPLLMLSEDLNVALPLTYWVTHSHVNPAAGDKNQSGEIPGELLKVDDRHVIWPRNTEYEIFSVGERQHTLGALFVLNHQSPLELSVPPWGPVGDRARQEGALLDMDKLDWPFAMNLPEATGATLYELANNHLWRTEFAFNRWNVPATPLGQPPHGGQSGNERDWLHYTLNMYYALLDAGYRLVPTAGTASGVHPVPVGFSRVYVKMPEGESFSYERWLQGLAQGRSFVTTGPRLLMTLEGHDPGHEFRARDQAVPLKLQGEIVTAQPLAYAEVVVNGRPVRTVMGPGRRLDNGSWRTEVDMEMTVEASGWVAVRCFEERSDGRLRFAHTAPWWLTIDGRPLAPTPAEKQYLVDRMFHEIQRSREIVPPEGLAEYQRVLEKFQQLPVSPTPRPDARRPADSLDQRRWLENMVWYHGYSRDEILDALDVPPESVDAMLSSDDLDSARRSERASDAPLRLLPYPGGRHPRRGFLDGALRPQRDTKLSVFLPWTDGEQRERDYVVVDLPEAIFTNLGLTYLAHTHVRTIWEDQGVTLPPLEWRPTASGGWESSRELPNGLAFGATATPERDQVAMELWLRNGTEATVTNIRAQVCVMLAAATGFHDQTGTNKLVRESVVAVHNGDNGENRRWILTAWEPLHRAWQNPPVPCLHSDPSLPDCPPGTTVRAHGRLAFYQGTAIEDRMRQLQREVSTTPTSNR